jgi:hypothetical protein
MKLVMSLVAGFKTKCLLAKTKSLKFSNIGPEASAWQFERISARSTSPTLIRHHVESFQVCAASMALEKISLPSKIRSAQERFFYMRMLGLMPLIRSQNLRERAFRFFNFDHVF